MFPVMQGGFENMNICRIKNLQDCTQMGGGGRGSEGFWNPLRFPKS